MKYKDLVLCKINFKYILKNPWFYKYSTDGHCHHLSLLPGGTVSPDWSSTGVL